MVQHNMDNIFHVVQLVHLKYPIQHLDNIHADRFLFQLYYLYHFSDLYVLNRSKSKKKKLNNQINYIQAIHKND